MPITRDKELWMAALLLEKKHGAAAATYVAGRCRKFEAEGDDGGVKLWTEIGQKLHELKPAGRN
ncbi:hypothetical protein [Croceicoccus sp. Ery15]|uniref:DUF6961 family protein n=1 Tax=Croceicoccus sp. Ery15 TaxID=1703338 RepID=UPI001E2F522A|nr:hypothetical protein [Croceicoccus sp. Ery15]